MNADEQGWIGRYLRHLSHERRLSPETVDNYRLDIEALARYLGEAGVEAWRTVDGEHVRQFAAAAFRRGLSPRSIQRRLSAVRGFFRYLRREKHVKRNPAEGVAAPKTGRRLPGNLDADRMARLLDIEGEGPLVDRDRAILELLYSSGLRLSELTGLDVDDVDTADATVRVTGKGSRERIVPVGRHALEALGRWRRSRAAFAGASSEKALFLSRRGSRLKQRSVQARVEYWARRQGIDTRVHPHLFRHSFATHVLESSHDLRGVQELLGHANIATTQVYTHLDFQHLAQIYDRAHPRARSRNKS